MSLALKKMDPSECRREPLAPPSRSEAVRFAIANTAIEGLSVSEDAQEILKKWANGELSDEDIITLSSGGAIGYTLDSYGR